MSYLKYGIVTKIEDLNNNFINNNFNLKLYKKDNNYYHIKEDVLNKNIKPFRKEIMNLSNNKGDSINSCEAYCLNTTADELLEHEIHFINDKYYFEGYNFLFDTEEICYLTDKEFLKLNFISLFWDINKVECDDFNLIASFLNNLLKKALTNCLKDASLLDLV